MIDWVNITSDEFHYDIDYSQTKAVSLKPIDAAFHTIAEIQKKYPPPYTLFLSGGVDSQAMLYAWHMYGAEFNTYSAIYNFDMNKHDLEYLKDFSKRYNIEINFQYFNLINFLHDDFHDYAQKYRCASPHICTFMRLSEEIKEGTCIFSGNFIYEKSRFIDKNNFGMYTYAKIENRNIVPWFFLETEDLAYGFYKSNYFFDNDYETKCKLYIENEFPVIKQTLKYTGFEFIKDYYDMNYTHLLTKEHKLLNSKKQPSKRTFDLLHRNKYDVIFGSDKYQLRYRDDHIC